MKTEEKKYRIYLESDIITVERFGLQEEPKFRKIRVQNSDDLIYDPLPWQEKGLQQTASGYSKKLVSTHKINVEGRLYRIYYCCYSNSGTSYIIRKGETIIID